MRRRTKIASALVAVASLSVGGVATAARVQSSPDEPDDEDDEPAAAARNVARVERRTLATEDRYDGTLAYRDSRTLSAPAATSSGGGQAGSSSGSSSRTVTSIVAAGDVLERGDVVHGLDAQATVVMYGDQPMYRSLSTSSDDGVDIRQLEENLVLLGYDTDGEIVVDETFTAATKAAVREWEADVGNTVDGTVDQSEVVFLPGPSVVASTAAGVGETVSAGTGLVDVVVTASTATVLTPVEGDIAAISASDQPAAGEALYQLDGIAVVTLIGDEPITRTLEDGDDGADVRTLQENLLQLGYDGRDPDGEDDEVLEVNGEFDDATRRAVEAMQEAVGQEVDGTVDPGDVAVVPAGYTVTSRLEVQDASTAEVAVNAEVLSLRSTRRVVEVSIALDEQDELAVGTHVRVDIPGADEVTGVVESVSAVASSAQSGGTAAEDATVTVTIALADGIDVAQIETPVDVYVDRVLAEDVLAVPVAALVALADGGFAVEVADGPAVRFIAVETGDYADNYVEVSGEGLGEGLEVVIP